MKILVLATSLLLTMIDPYPDFSNKTLSEINEDGNWEIIAEARGNLYLDTNEDLAIVLQSKNIFSEKRCEDCEIKKHRARIIVVLMNKNNVLKVMMQNNLFIAREDEGGITKDLKPELSIKDKKLTVSYIFLRGETNYTFEVYNNDIVLVSAFKLGASHYLYQSETVDCKTGMLVSESRSEKDVPAKTKTTKLADNQFKKLSELKMMGTWEVAEGVFF